MAGGISEIYKKFHQNFLEHPSSYSQNRKAIYNLRPIGNFVVSAAEFYVDGYDDFSLQSLDCLVNVEGASIANLDELLPSRKYGRELAGVTPEYIFCHCMSGWV